MKVERIEGEAPFYAYGVINDQANSDGSFVFPVTASALEGKMAQTLPVIVETRGFTSELTVTNFSEKPRTLDFEFVSEHIQGDDKVAGFQMELKAGEQQIVPALVEALRPGGDGGAGGEPGLLRGGRCLPRRPEGDLSGIVIGARTGSQGGGGQYSVFYNAVPNGEAFIREAWGDGAAAERGEPQQPGAGQYGGGGRQPERLPSGDPTTGETGMSEETLVTQPIPARGWHQIDEILRGASPETRQGYVRIEKVSGENPFLAYGVVNDGGGPGATQRRRAPTCPRGH